MTAWTLLLPLARPLLAVALTLSLVAPARAQLGASDDDASAADAAADDPNDESAGADAPITRRTVDPLADELASDQAAAEHRQAERVLLVDERAQQQEHGTEDRDHEQQVSFRATASHLFLLGLGYGDSPRCDAPRQSDGGDQVFCARVEEPALDLELGFSVTSRLQLGAFFQYGLIAAEHTLGNAISFGVGLRSFTSDDALVKGVLGARALLHFANSNIPDYPGGYPEWDFGLRGEAGIQVDPIRWLGFYATGALSIRLVKGFYLLPELGAGVEVRFP